MVHPSIERARALLGKTEPADSSRLLRKTYEPPPPVPEQEPQRQAQVPQTVPEMTPEAQRPWDNWVHARIDTALDGLVEMLGAEAAIIEKRIRADLREAFATAIGELRTEHAIKMAAMQGEINKLSQQLELQRAIVGARKVLDLEAVPAARWGSDGA
jgi:hypothetical protein